MKFKFKYFIISVLIISVGLYIYATFPRSGTTYELVLDKYNNTEFSTINIIVNNEEYKFKDMNEINIFIDKLKSIKIKEGKIKEDINSEIEVRMYSENFSEKLGFTILDNKYLRFYGSENGRYKTAIYKIVEETNIDELINNIKGGIEVKEG
ncbi:MAG: hypothetical protein E6248_02845 [Clostridium sp.]|uniref:hypothetical protein n=1 Tax=Clostridium sp. TaxID=1506 RepID=UPI00290AF382|nr:hypothetical protein [Clostridium sp.]MDU5109357.1 hypothetical protein [Clostridium sp.]